MRIAIRLVIIVLMVGFFTYARHRSGTQSGGGAVSPGGVPMVQAEKNDPRLAAATNEAKRRFPEFVAAFQNPGAKRGFMVKHAFRTKDRSEEHMWIVVNTISGGQVSGALMDQPYGDIGHKEGDTITLTADQVEDWVYFDNGAQVGDFSKPVLQAIEAESKKK